MNNKSEVIKGLGVSFERIRRITGFLGSIDQWNNGKKAELKDRVIHSK